MRIEAFLLKSNRLLFIAIGIVLLLLINIIITSFPFSESIKDLPEFDGIRASTSFWVLFFVVIIAPLFETIMFQYIPIKLISILLNKKKQRIKEYTCILCSALLFAAIHCYNITYIVITFLGGIIFAYLFILSGKRKEFPIINIAIMHSVLNFIASAIDLMAEH